MLTLNILISKSIWNLNSIDICDIYMLRWTLADAEPWVRLCAHVMMKRKNGDDAYLSSLPDDALGPVR